jgi:palmitoyl-protein thioesterase
MVEDIDNSYLMDINLQISKACEMIKNDTKLQGGYNALGFSQGGLFMRAVAQRCPTPPIHNLIAVGGPQQGVFGLPRCLGSVHRLCEMARKLLDHGAYIPWVQQSLVPAQYWQDPFNMNQYRTKSLFLADINNEREVNITYVEKLSKVKNFVMVLFNNDSVVQPKESEWFGYYDPGQDQRTHTLQHSPLYLEDRLGLRKMDEQGRLKFLATDGDHLQFGEDWFVRNIAQPFLMS